jgi:soluble lytic murein transglycosylase-like protein
MLNKKKNKKNKKYSYYFDNNLVETNYFFMFNKNILISVFAVSFIFIASFSLSYLSSSKLELSKIKSFITSHLEVNKNNLLNEKEINTLSLEVQKLSRKFDVDPMLVLAVIDVESSFNKKAVSRVGARGLMQIMPMTALHIAEKIGLKNDVKYKLYNIKINLLLGVYYLSSLAKRYNYDKKLYLTAYNYGPANLSKIIDSGKKLPEFYYSKVLNKYKKFSM